MNKKLRQTTLSPLPNENEISLLKEHIATLQDNIRAFTEIISKQTERIQALKAERARFDDIELELLHEIIEYATQQFYLKSEMDKLERAKKLARKFRGLDW